MAVLATFASRWVPGPCGAPDVPNGDIGDPPPALSAIREVTNEEGEELSSKYQQYHHHPPPTLGELCELSNHQPIRITIKINVFGEDDHQCTKYECTLLREQLYVYIPDATIEKSRQAFIRLLEFAEEDVEAKRVVVYFEKKNPDRGKNF